jgi:hypothetical protein
MPRINPTQQAELLKEVRETNVTTAGERIRVIRVCLHVFGYSHLRKDDIEHLGIDIHEAAEEYGWRIEEAKLAWGIWPEDVRVIKGRGLVIAESDKPTAKQVREILGKTKSDRQTARRG